jgi:hypothetical protein
MMKHLNLFTLFLLMASCAPEAQKEKTTIRVNLPQSAAQSGLRHYKPKSQLGTNTLSSLDDIDCYAILIEKNQTQGICEDSSSTALAHANFVFGSFPDGSQIELDIDTGDNQTFHLVGFSYNDGGSGFCPDFVSFPILDQQKSSQVRLLASRTVNVQGEVMTVELTRNVAGPDIHTCKNLPFEWETSSVAIWDVALWDAAAWGP